MTKMEIQGFVPAAVTFVCNLVLCCVHMFMKKCQSALLSGTGSLWYCGSILGKMDGYQSFISVDCFRQRKAGGALLSCILFCLKLRSSGIQQRDVWHPWLPKNNIQLTSPLRWTAKVGKIELLTEGSAQRCGLQNVATCSSRIFYSMLNLSGDQCSVNKTQNRTTKKKKHNNHVNK